MVSGGTRPVRAARHPRSKRSEEHTSELQSQSNLVCRLLLEKKKNSLLKLGNTPLARMEHPFSELERCRGKVGCQSNRCGRSWSADGGALVCGYRDCIVVRPS